MQQYKHRKDTKIIFLNVRLNVFNIIYIFQDLLTGGPFEEYRFDGDCVKHRIYRLGCTVPIMAHVEDGIVVIRNNIIYVTVHCSLLTVTVKINLFLYLSDKIFNCGNMKLALCLCLAGL